MVARFRSGGFRRFAGRFTYIAHRTRTLKVHFSQPMVSSVSPVNLQKWETGVSENVNAGILLREFRKIDIDSIIPMGNSTLTISCRKHRRRNIIFSRNLLHYRRGSYQ